MRRLLLSLVTVSFFTAPLALQAWDYAGHRAVNLLALEALPSEFPKFVNAPEARERIAFLSGEPDRWRNTSELSLKHMNSPDHYIDLEDLAEVDQTPDTLTEFRYVFTGQLALARQAHPDRFAPIDAEKNKDHTRELIGFLPWTIAEYYGKLYSAFSYLKTFEENGTAEEIANAQANVIYLMGLMGHFVGDGAQPLHTTRHHNGWEGANAQNYTTARTFHAWIDGGFLGKSGTIEVNRLSSEMKPAQLLPLSDKSGRSAIFSSVMQYLVEQHAKVEPLYQLEKAGHLKAEKNQERQDGRRFLETQITVGAQMLSNLWLTAWRSAPPDTYLRASLLERKLKNGEK